ncbi:MAG: MFS transporter [candidate division WOR-3 bacterium]
MEEKKFKKNFPLGVINGILMNLVDTITGSSTVLPLYLSHLTKSSIVIGFGSSLYNFLWPMPQLFTAFFLEGKKRKKFVYDITAYIRFFSIFFMSILIFINPKNILPLFLLSMFIYHTSGGIAGLPFMDIVAKTISPSKQHLFWGLRIAIGGFLSILGGFLVKFILAKYNYPVNFSILFFIASIFVGIGLYSFCLVYEPEEPEKEREKSFLKFLKTGFLTILKDRRFTTLFSLRTLAGISLALEPFFMIYVINVLNMRVELSGILISLRMAGLLISNFLWDYIQKKKSLKHLFIISSITGMVIPVLAYFSFQHHFLIFILFFINGIFYSGIQVASPSLLLTISPSEKRSTYIGFYNTLLSPIYLFPVINGIIIDKISFNFAFLVSFIVSFISLFLSLKLRKL